MNIALSLRVLLLSAAFAYSFLALKTSNGMFVAQLDDLFFAGMVFLGSASVSFFAGFMRVILAQRRDLPRPSLRAPILFGSSPVQFFWYTGMLFVSGGVGSVVGHLNYTLILDGVLLVAGGLGFISGSVLTLKIMARRFVRLTKNRTEE